MGQSYSYVSTVYPDFLPNFTAYFIKKSNMTMNQEEQNHSDGESQPSLFKGFRDTCPHAVTWDEVFRLLTSGELKESTERFRYFQSHGLENDARLVKSSAPGITPAVQCSGGRRMEQISGYTRFSLGDFDHIPPEDVQRCLALLRTDEHAFLVYITFSGEGLRIIFPADDVTSYSETFRQGNEYFAALIGHEYDPQCKNPGRLSSLCHDPEAFYNPHALPLHILPKPKPRPADKPATRRTCHAVLKDAEGAVLAELEKWGYRYEAGRHNEYISRAAYLLNRYGVDEKEALAWALVRFADYGASQVEPAVCSCYRQTAEHGTIPLPTAAGANGKGGRKFASMEEIENFLTSQARFRHNVITNQCEVAMGEDKHFCQLTDRDVNTLWKRLNTEIGRVYVKDLQNIINSEYVPLFRPFPAYLESLPLWDGVTDYIGRLAATVHVKGDQACFAEYFRKWFVGIIATLMVEDTVNHEILVLIGNQGIYKTTWFHYLLPPALRRYFYAKTNSNRMDKDDKLTLSEFALVCFEEIDGLRPSDLNQLKAMTTLPKINERPSYGHYKEQRPHIASFCGTGNSLQFLTDPTGNRRWLPFEVESIDNPYECPVNYEGVYSQAHALWKGGFNHWFEKEDIARLAEHNRDFEAPLLEEELIRSYYRRPLLGEQPKFVTTARILERINAAIRQPLSPVKIGMVMKKLGFEAIRSGGLRGYLLVACTPDEIGKLPDDSQSAF